MNKILHFIKNYSKDFYTLYGMRDEATGLLNRNAFEIDKKSTGKTGVILCDLNNLKIVNDTLGHKEGDKLIQSFADVLKPFKSYRIGGDEFVIIEKDVKSMLNAINIIQNSGIDVAIGWAFPTDDIETVIQEADTMMYKNKIEMKASISPVTS